MNLGLPSSFVEMLKDLDKYFSSARVEKQLLVALKEFNKFVEA
jgi:hypothetical protein